MRSTIHSPSMFVMLAVASVAGAACVPPATNGAAPSGPRTVLYVGNEGAVTWLAADAATASLEKKGSLPLGLTASFMAGSSDGKHLYALLRTIDEMKQQAAG